MRILSNDPHAPRRCVGFRRDPLNHSVSQSRIGTRMVVPPCRWVYADYAAAAVATRHELWRPRLNLCGVGQKMM
jgi:hypothetical protein